MAVWSIMKGAVEGLISPLTSLYANRQERIAAESAARAGLDRVLAEAAATDAAVAGQIALVNAKNQNNTWKDEFALITISAPFWAAMVLGPLGSGDLVAEMFTTMQAIPAFWSETFKIAILAALGVTSIKKVLS